MPSPLRAGGYSVDITPPLGISMPGGFTDRKARGVYDRLYASSLVLQNASREVALVSCDLIAVDAETVARVRSLASKLSGIPPENIMVAATHTHTGPQLSPLFYNIGGIDQAYVDFLVKQIASSIVEAKSRAVCARIGFAEGSEPTLVFNRRLMSSDGRVFMNFSVDKTKSMELGLKPLGPVDPSVGVVRIDDSNGQPLALIVEYALHNAVAGGDLISSGFPGALRSNIRKLFGEGVTVLFFAGPCGNVNHIDISNLKQPSGYPEVERIGMVLTGEVIKAWVNIPTTTEVDIDVRRRVIEIQERPLGKVDEGDRAFGNDNDIIRRQYERERLEIIKRPIGCVSVELSAILVNDAVFLMNPAELFVEFGLKLKERSPFLYTFPVELANGFVGYVPTRTAFDEGGYEPRRTVYTSRLACDAGDIIVDELLHLISSLNLGLARL